MDILSSLNPAQRAAVEYIDGPSLVIAGAGSGKTRVLTHKIAYLLERGMEPWNILALTFTNKAANEMKARVAQLVGEERARHLHMGTFHSIFARILRREAPLLGYESRFTIYDTDDSRSLIRAIIRDLVAENSSVDEKAYKPVNVLARISRAKNRLITAEQYAADHSAQAVDAEQRMPLVSEIFTRYEARCKAANAMDFDDLLVLTHRLFSQHDDVRRRYASWFDYVLVDEYQDTNYAQQQIVVLLTQEHQHLCVVGDDYQSIYGFRGANIDNILKFQQVFPQLRIFKLEQNYRSTQNIVAAANALMKHNRNQIDKNVFSAGDKGEKLQYKPAHSDREEAVIVCNDIARLRRREGAAYNDFAILYRTNAQSRAIEEEMKRRAIPYRIYGGLSFYQRKEIKDITAYFRLVVNPADEEAFKRVVNYPKRGIGATTLQQLSASATQSGMSLMDAVARPADAGLALGRAPMQKLQAFRQLIAAFAEQARTLNAYEAGRLIIVNSGIRDDLYASTDPEALSRQENVEEFLAAMRDFVESRQEEDGAEQASLHDFIQEVALLTDLDSDADSDAQDEADRVVMMTIHAAKGLEFPTVFIVGLEENIFPSPLSVNSARQLEEERRLLYVAITRAERHCILTNAQNRWRFGQMQFDTPSRFLQDIPSELLDVDTGLLSASGSSFGPSQGRGGGLRWGSERRQSGAVWGQPSAGSSPEPRRQPAQQRPSAPVEPAPGSRLRPLSSATATHLSRTPKATAACPVVVGDEIEHVRFGHGRVMAIEGSGESTKLTVEFAQMGVKQLLLKFAKFTVV